MARLPKSRIIFISGTDTGVGKTVLTTLLLRHLRQRRSQALAVKPFCTGNLRDVEILRAAQDRELSALEICPFFFPEPIAPLVAARLHNRRVGLASVLEFIGRMASRCECLLVEGAGGVLAPLGNNYSARELVSELGCELIIVCANKLGTINHSRLAVECMHKVASRKRKLVMMEQRRLDASAPSNLEILSELLRPVPVYSLPFLGTDAVSASSFKKNEKKIKKVLASILA